MKNESQRKIGIILSYLNMFLQVIISLVYTPVMLNLLGQSEYGLYSLSSSTISYLSLITLGMGGAYTRFYIRYKVSNDERGINTLNGMYLVFYLITAFIALFTGSIVIINIDSIFISLTHEELMITKVLMSLLIINLAISFPCSLFTSYIGANEQFVVQRLITIVRTVISPLVVLPVLLLGYGSIGYTLVTVIVNILIEAANIIFAFHKLKMSFSFRGFRLSLFKELFLFSFFILLNQIIDQVNNNVGNLLLGIYKGSLAVAIYGVAKTITNYFFSFSTAISSVYAPKVNKLVASKASNMEISKLMTSVGRAQFIIMALILSGLYFFGKPFVYLWAGEEYINAYYIILILCTPVIVPLIQNIGIEIQRAMNKHKIRSIAYAFMAIINVAISIPMIIYYGEIGAAIGTCLSYILCNIIFMNFYYHKGLNLDMIYFWREIFKFVPSLIIPLILGVIIRYNINLYSWKHLLFFIFLYVCIYCLSMWTLGLSKKEKAIILKFFNKIKGTLYE